MQESFGIINLAIVEGKPVVCSLPQLIGHFVDHRRDVVTRRAQYDLKKALERMHLLDGFRIALLNLDEVIELIKAAQTPHEARANLCTRFSLSEIQAQAILDLRLQKLTGMERLAIEQEHAELKAEIDRLRTLLADTQRIDRLIIAELKEVREKFGDERRTEIADQGADINVEDLIEDEEMVVTVSHSGYAKRTSVSLYRSQRRGGKGVTGATSKDEDFVEHLFVASTLSYLMAFTSLGRAYWLKVYEIPESGRAARGRALINLLNLKENEKVSAILPVREFIAGRSVLLSTRKGVVKKVELMEFSNPRKGGVIAVSLDEGDELIGAELTEGNFDVILGTSQGMSIRFDEGDVRAMGRSARGVIGIRLDEGDRVVGMTVAAKQKEGVGDDSAELALMTVCDNGYGKRTLISEYRSQTRGGKGVIDIQAGGRNGDVVGVFATTRESGMMIITSGGKVIRTMLKDIRLIGRNTMGVRLIDLDEGEKVVAVAHLNERDDETEGTDVVQ
jgi:DNA gyrase subunit A